jgi:threonylcarbamoyladenosine tRNA methylthiotransferase CDKAL1
VKRLRKEIPGIRISTDIICGFPGESEKDFEETMKLVQWLKPEAINISKFYPRPGTDAKQMKQLPNSVIKNRSRKLSALMAQIRKANK